MVAITPHAPIMVPEVGRGEDRKVAQSQQALLRLGQEVQEAAPDTLIFITPHAPIFRDGIAILGTSTLQGNFGQFNARQVAFDYANDLELAQSLVEEAEAAGIPTVLLNKRVAAEYGVSTQLDHGVMVPLYFLVKNWSSSTQNASAAGSRAKPAGSSETAKPAEPVEAAAQPDKTAAPVKATVKPVLPKLLVLAYGLLPFLDLYAFGQVINRAVVRTGRRAVLIASGDLSHRLTPDAPAGYRPEGAVFDQRICTITAEADVAGLLNLPPGLAEQAGECGLRSMIIGWGAADGRQVHPEVYSYEGPFGVGYMVANLGIGVPDADRHLLAQLKSQQQQAQQDRRAAESALVRLARESLENYIRHGRRLTEPKMDLSEFGGPAGTFVSIKKHGELRGCIGTIAPTQPNLVQEIIENAISAGTRDPRFAPVTPDELAELVYSVDVLSEPEPIESLAELDPLRYGVIVSRGSRRGLLLPNLEGIDTAEEQVAIARQKAGIGPREPVQLERFEVKRYT
jgi:AmmeMemoRadiSam system protein A